MSAVDANVAAGWPAAATRRGALAAATFVLVFVAGDFGFWRATTEEQWTAPLFYLWIPFATLAALPLLGPMPVRATWGARPSARAMLCGILCGLLGIAWFSCYWKWLGPPCSVPRGEVLPAALVPMYASTILLGPFAEEWLYRGVLFRAATTLAHPVVAHALVASAFAIGHGPERLREFPFLFAYGVLLGALRHASGSVSPPLLAHTVTNLGLMLAPGVWLWWLGL